MKKKYSYILILTVIILCVVLDIVTKIIFANIFSSEQSGITIIPNFFEFTFVKNTGAAYGIFGGNTIPLIIVTIVFIIGFLVFDIFNHSNNGWYISGLSLILGGAIGNLIDRIFLGYVRDFISIQLFSFVFNLADLFITVGVICFIIYIIVMSAKEYKEKKGNHNEVDS